MKATVKTTHLQERASIAARLAQKSANLPILSHILLTAENDTVTVSATDLEVGVRLDTLAKVEEQGQVAVPGKTLADLLSSCADDDLTLEAEGNTLHIAGEQFAAQLSGQNAEDFPIIPTVEEETGTIEMQPLVHALSLVSDFTAPTQIRPELAGVYVHIKGKQLTTAASDSFRLAEKRIELTSAVSGNKEVSFILPHKAAREIVSVCASREGEAELRVSENQVEIRASGGEAGNGEIRLVSQLIEGAYPSYGEIIPDEFTASVSVGHDEFMRALRSVTPFAGKSGAVQVTARPGAEADGGSPDEGTVQVFAESSDVGKNRMSVSADVDGEEVTATFNCRYITDGLGKISADTALFRLSGAEGPALLTAPDDDSYRYVVMPIKQQ